MFKFFKIWESHSKNILFQVSNYCLFKTFILLEDNVETIRNFSRKSTDGFLVKLTEFGELWKALKISILDSEDKFLLFLVRGKIIKKLEHLRDINFKSFKSLEFSCSFIFVWLYVKDNSLNLYNFFNSWHQLLFMLVIGILNMKWFLCVIIIKLIQERSDNCKNLIHVKKFILDSFTFFPYFDALGPWTFEACHHYFYNLSKIL